MLGNFAVARYRFVLQATTPLRLHAFAGATLRGGFGHVFKRTVCVWPPGDCPKCLLKHTCSYPYIFETAPPPGTAKLRGLEQIPRPYVLEPPEGPGRSYGAGESLEFRLVLVGRAIDYLPYFVLTFTELGRNGLGRDRGRFTVAEVHAESRSGDQLIFTAAEGTLRDGGNRQIAADFTAERFARTAADVDGPVRFTVHFQTPTRIRNDGEVRAVVSFQDLTRALLRRLSSLCYFHCGRELSVDFKSLIEQASSVRTADERLRWQDQERFSGRQRQRIPMGGLVGTVEYEAPNAEKLRPFLPLLAAGELVHVGKGVVVGLGRYRVKVG